jgi:hypothetical protein
LSDEWCFGLELEELPINPVQFFKKDVSCVVFEGHIGVELDAIVLAIGL